MTSPLLIYLQKQLSEKLGKDVLIQDCKQVLGGDINTTYIINTQKGNFFLKQNNSATTDMFEKELHGLELLHNKSDIKIPQPIFYGLFNNTAYLVMECLEKGNTWVNTWQKIGAGLANIHRQTQQKFGFGEHNYIGSLHQQNTLTDSWPNFYAECRILPLIKDAFEKGRCTKEDLILAERLCGQLQNIFPEEVPALLHGDLWSGNFMPCLHDEVAVFDPAVYYGHREMDIAMTLLFGGFHQSFYVHYNEAYPLEKGWQARVSLCQLYPLLVHLNLFGSAYYPQVKGVLNQYK